MQCLGEVSEALRLKLPVFPNTNKAMYRNKSTFTKDQGLWNAWRGYLLNLELTLYGFNWPLLYRQRTLLWKVKKKKTKNK